jgi:hypothetical protein
MKNAAPGLNLIEEFNYGRVFAKERKMISQLL